MVITVRLEADLMQSGLWRLDLCLRQREGQIFRKHPRVVRRLHLQLVSPHPQRFGQALARQTLTRQSRAAALPRQ